MICKNAQTIAVMLHVNKVELSAHLQNRLVSEMEKKRKQISNIRIIVEKSKRIPTTNIHIQVFHRLYLGF